MSEQRQRALAEAIRQMLAGPRRLLELERAEERRKERRARKTEKASELDGGRAND